ncbi:hypothetical protein M3148_00390 [Georgenia satyanarayanai]|uniref:hypothetical protein n=1 Tax=Georgenia satyanarayanai TaxID=860221 RepID=UPI002041E08C|nr:hypothetical protein [Georgenia satyanarayanai]MCM3659459.1 hypothetical protein [Georgenia satyanarayanai]
MRLSHALVVARMLLAFFGRRVLSVGALRLRSVRFAALGTAVVLLVSLTAVARQFLLPYSADREVWDLLFATSTVSLVLWVMVAFIFVKVLFLSSDGVLELTYQLPLTNKERSVAFLLFEAAITLGVALATAVPVMTSAVLLMGPSAVGQILTSMLAPIGVAYLALSLCHVVATRLLSAMRTRPVADLLALLGIFALIVAYAGQMTDLMWHMTDPAASGALVWPTAIAWFAQRAGLGAAMAAVVVVCAVLLVVIVHVMPSRHLRTAKYLDIRLPRRVAAHLTPYDWCLLRSQHTFIGTVVGVALFGYLLAATDLNPLWSLCTLTIGGLYLFSATAPLRELTGQRQPAWRIYLLSLRPQVLLIGAVGVPALLLTAAFGRAEGTVVVVLSALISAALTTCLGIIVPSEKDNPLAAFVALATAAVVLTLIALGLGMLQLPVPAGLLGATALFVVYAIEGIRQDEKRRRNEEGNAGHQLRRRGNTADARRRRALPAVPHVLGG